MALELKFTVQGVSEAKANARYKLFDSADKNIGSGVIDIASDGRVVIPIESAYVSLGENIQAIIDGYDGNDFSATQGALGIGQLSEVYVPYSITQDGYYIACIRETGTADMWAFGDGHTSDEEFPNYMYQTNGTFTITHGTFSKTIKVDTVILFDVAIEGNVITCTDQSGFEETWYFGNGDTSKAQNPTYTYYENGEYVVSFGVFSTVITVDYYTAGLVESVLNNVVTLILPGTETVIWDYGDGTTGTSLVHEYAQAGKYLVSSGEYRFFVVIEGVEMPTISYTAIADDTLSNLIHFTAFGADRYEWHIEGINYTGEVIEHTYTIDGLFFPVLKGILFNGNAAQYSKEILVQFPNIAPVINAIITEPRLLTIEFTVDVTNEATETLSYLWDLGDEGTSTDYPYTHTFSADGDYAISVTVSDGRGGEDTLTKTITASSLPDYGAEFIVDPTFSETTLNTEWRYSATVLQVDMVEDDARQTALMTVLSGTTTTANVDVTGLIIGTEYAIITTAKASAYLKYGAGDRSGVSVYHDGAWVVLRADGGFDNSAEYNTITNTFIASADTCTIHVVVGRVGDDTNETSRLYLDQLSFREVI